LRPITPKVLVVLLILGMSTASVRAGTDSIDLENRTYTPMHYRMATPDGPYSEWRVLLPGARAHYGDHGQLVIDVWFNKDRSEQYNVHRGYTYAFDRKEPGAPPEINCCDGPAPEVPTAPGPPPAKADSAKASFAPLSKFVAACGKLKHPYRLSLKKLAAKCAKAQKTGGKLPPELRYVHGFTWFVGYLVDDENQDVVLLGIKDPSRPPVDIDCLVTAIKGAYSDSVPHCSLDAHPDPDLQKSVIIGVPWKTRWAEVMIQADYDMKRLSQGDLDPAVPGFMSWIRHFDDILSRQGIPGEGRPSAMEGGHSRYNNRCWFNFNSQLPRAIADGGGKLVYLYRNPVRLSTEQAVNGAFGSGQATASATRFADNFTEHLEILSKHYPSIAELQAMFRLYDLMRHLRQVSQAVPPEMTYWVKKYEPPYQGPPSAMPTLRVTRKIQVRMASGQKTQTWNFWGGVDMRVGITRHSLKRLGRFTPACLDDFGTCKAQTPRR
jgi:hypothetical protein